MNKYLYILFIIFLVNCKSPNAVDFIVTDESSLNYDEIIISDGNGNYISSDKNKKRETILRLKFNNQKSKNIIEGQFNVKLLKDKDTIEDKNFGYWGLGSFFSTYEIIIAEDSIFTKHSSNS